MDIFNKIIQYKKEQNKEINNILNIKNDYSINFKNNKLILLNTQNNKILKGDYIFFGIYQPTKNLWIWSNSIPGVSRLQIDIIKTIKDKSFIFENNYENKILFIYQFLTNDVIEITSTDLLEIIENVLSYLSESKTIFKPLNSYGNIQYIGLTKIQEKYF
jgi:hypothetical protein